MNRRTADEVFNDTLDQPVSARAEFLRRACGDDVKLRREVESLLSAHDRADDFMASSRFAVQPPQREIDGDDPANLIGEAIGRYRIIEVIAVGGMGAVYRALREDNGFVQQVAIKLIRRDIATPGMIRRFQKERSTLAALEHAGITRLIDGDTTPDGLPYLVMELVDGSPIDEYCETHELTIDERLRLFLGACDAVQFAHRHLVVHRDLKPANILVTAEKSVKLCDFGIAKLLEPETEGAGGRETIGVLRLLTPQYASPEQVSGGRLSTATDIYSLGAILYELLTGCPVWESDERRQRAAAPGRIHDEPMRPSSRIVRRPGDVAKTNMPDDGAASQIARRLRGDLDTIVLKALRERPEERYASVEQFAEDIRRHLSGLPVLARPQTLSYRAARFARRHRAALIAAGVVLASLVTTIAVTGTSLIRARKSEVIARQRQQDAESSSLKARRVGAFLQETLANANPLRAGGQTTILDLLADATSRAATELHDEPAVAAEVYLTIGKTYGKIWRWKDAASALRTSLALHRAQYPHDCEELADCLSWYGRALTFMGDGSAVEIQREGLAIREKLYPPDHPQIAESEGCLGYSLWNIPSRCDFVEAERHYQRALEIHRNCSGPPSSDHARMAFSFGVMLARLDRRSESERHFREALTIYRSSQQPDDRYMLACVEMFAKALDGWGRPGEALRYADEAITMMPVGLDPCWRGEMLRMRAKLYRQLGNTPEALQDSRASLIIAYEELAKDSADLRGLVPAAAALISGELENSVIGVESDGRALGVEPEDSAIGVTRYDVIDAVRRHHPEGFEQWLARVEGLANLLYSAGHEAEAAAWASAIQEVRTGTDSTTK